MKQLKIDSEKCVACALCQLYSDLIEIDDEGYAVAKNKGVLEEDEIDLADKAVALCPEKAIVVSDYQSEFHITSAGELMYFIKTNFENYELPRIKHEDIEFPLIRNGGSTFGSTFIVSDMQNTSIGQIYTSERKAESAGMRDVSNNVNNVAKVALRNWLSEYKTGVLNKYRIFEKEKGNYYYDCITQAEEKLKQCSIECKNLFRKELPEDILQIKSTAVWNPDINRKNSALDYLEDRLINIAMEEIESPSWYDSWVDVDGDEKIWTVSIYGANQKISEHAWEGLKEAVEYRNVYPIVEQTIGQFNKNLVDEMREKYKEIIEFLDKNTTFSQLLQNDTDWENKARKKEMHRLESTGDLTSFRRIISLQKLGKENIKPYSMNSYYSLELDVKDLDGKRVKAGEIYKTITQGKHIHNRNANMGLSQPYGCGQYVNLKDSYELKSEVDGVIHIFDDMINEDRTSIGVIAHQNDTGDLCQWYNDNK